MYSQISLNNCISIKKISYLKGTISIGHDCIILIFDFEGFYDNHRRLLSKNYYFRQKKWIVIF